MCLAVSAAFGQGQKPALFIGDQAPALTIDKWVKGDPINQLGHGQVSVVEFWATWCGPCKQSIPHLTELAKKYGSKVNFIGVDSFERIPSESDCFTKVGKFVTDFGDKMDYHVAMDGTANQTANDWMKAAQQPGIPTAFVVDKDGKIAWIGHPMVGLDETLQQVLAGTFDEKAEADKELKAIAEQQAQSAKQEKIFGPITTALKNKDYKGAVAAADNAIKSDPSTKMMLEMNEPAWMVHYDEPGAINLSKKLADGDFKDNAQALNSLAWAMVQNDSAFKHPDYALAVQIAEKAVKLSKGDPDIVDTLALSYYRAGRTKDAIATEQKAIDAAGKLPNFDAATLKQMKDQLAMYQKPISSR